DSADDVPVRGKAARDGRESDWFNEARAQQRGIQPVEVFRGVLQHPQSIFRRRAEDLQEWELLVRTPRPEGRDGDPLDVSLDRPHGELERREFRDLPFLQEIAKTHPTPLRASGPPSTSR